MAVLIPELFAQLNEATGAIVLSFLGERCVLCEEGRGIAVKDAEGMWQLWCLQRALSFLPDDSYKSLVDAPLTWSLADRSLSPTSYEPLAFLYENELKRLA